MSIPCQIGNAILANNSNAVRAAILSATAQRPSTDIRLLSKAASGRGRVLVTTPGYTGASDSLIEAEVLSTAGGTLRTSAPVVRGVGSGTLNVTSIASGAATQKLTFTLANPGDPADKALLDFYGVALVAKTAGAAGNALTLTVARNLTMTELPFATLEDISANTASWTGEQWNWGGVSEQNGGIPATAPRIQFAGFPQVHRAYKKWVDGKWEHKIDPAPAYAIPKGTRLLAVSGDYTLNLSGENYTGITLYDVLKEIAARSLLVDIDGTVAEDRAPGGMAVTDIPLNTDAHALPAQRTTKNGKGSVSNVTVGVAAPTENVTLTYLQNNAGWSVTGDVSGRIGTATTGTPFFSNVLGFTVDAIPGETTGKISAKPEFIDRKEGEGLPSICFNPLRLGAKATDKTITFTYTERPPADCPCTGAMVGTINDSCLGLTGDDFMSAIPSTIAARLVSLQNWAQDLISQQANFQTTTNVAVAKYDMDLIEGALKEYQTALIDMAEAPAGLAEWDAKFTALQAEMLVLAGVIPAFDYVLVATAYTGGAYPYLGDELKPGKRYYNECTKTVYLCETGDNITYAFANLTPSYCYWSLTGSTSLSYGQSGVATMTAIASTVGDIYRVQTPAEVAQILRKYTAQMNHCRAVGGILPKSNASTLGDGCWLDDTSATGWWVADDPDLLPMFSNKTYVSSTMINNAPYSTQEFGLGLEVTCPDRLKYGDKIIVKIGNTASSTGYVVGDILIIPLVRGAAATFAGGTDTDPTQIWAVFSSTAGAQPGWSYNPTAPTPYVGLITAALVPGGIPSEAGDRIEVSIEGGTMRWRRDGGAWLTVDLYATTTLGDGLTLSASPAASPSFVAGDVWSYKAIATYGLDNLRQPRVGQAYAWDGAATTLTIDLGALTACELVAIAMHNLPTTATVTLNGAAMTVRDGVMLNYAPDRTASTLTLSISGAGAGASIGWVYAGNGWRPTLGASTITIERQFGFIRGQSVNPAALYLGQGSGGVIEWKFDDKSGLDAAEADALDALVRYAAAQGAEPVIVVPDISNPNPRPALCIIDADRVSFADYYDYQRGDELAIIDVSLPLRGVLA